MCCHLCGYSVYSTRSGFPVLLRTKHAKTCKMHETIPLLLQVPTDSLGWHLKNGDMDDAHRQDHRIRKNTQLFWHGSAVTFKLPVKGSGSPSKTWNTKTSQNKHCPRKRLQSKSLSVCLKHSVEALLVTCVAFQYAPSSVYSSMSFTPNLNCAFRSLTNIQSSFQ